MKGCWIPVIFEVLGLFYFTTNRFCLIFSLPNGPFVFLVLQVTLIGMVSKKAERVTDVSFTIDDGTGQIHCNRWYLLGLFFYIFDALVTVWYEKEIRTITRVCFSLGSMKLLIPRKWKTYSRFPISYEFMEICFLTLWIESVDFLVGCVIFTVFCLWFLFLCTEMEYMFVSMGA